MDMACCPICSNLILPLSPSSSVSSSSSTTIPGVQAQASTTGGEGDRQQGSSCQTFASHCVSALSSNRQQHKGCYMSNGAFLSLTFLIFLILYDYVFFLVYCVFVFFFSLYESHSLVFVTDSICCFDKKKFLFGFASAALQ